MIDWPGERRPDALSRRRRPICTQPSRVAPTSGTRRAPTLADMELRRRVPGRRGRAASSTRRSPTGCGPRGSTSTRRTTARARSSGAPTPARPGRPRRDAAGLRRARGVPADPGRAAPVPVLMLTARDDEADILVGLAVGADDYLTKPFRMRELVARVARPAAPRRPGRRARRPAGGPSRRGRPGRRHRRATGRRWRARRCGSRRPSSTCWPGLAAAPGEVLTRERLLAEVWDWPDASGHPHRRQPRQGAARQDRRRPGAHRARRRLRARGPARATRPVSSPLPPVTSIKVKLGLLVAASVLVADGGRHRRASRPASRCCSPSRSPSPSRSASPSCSPSGMTSPLREMTEAARRMARGDYRGRVARRLAATRSASWPARSTRWPPTWPPSTASGATWSPPSPTSCARRWPR